MPTVIICERRRKGSEHYFRASLKHIDRQLFPLNHHAVKTLHLDSINLTPEQWYDLIEENGYDPEWCTVRACLGNRLGRRSRLYKRRYRRGKGGFPTIFSMR